jgi:eukaryotic-like serine/threonine-protein kinase
MQFPRRMAPLREWHMPEATRRGAKRWVLWGLAAVLAGYVTSFFLFPTPILHGHQTVPRVLGLPVQEATRQLRTAGLEVHDGGNEPHPSAPTGTIIWQDPPPGITAPAGLRVTLVVSSGPPKIPVPDVSGLDGSLARRLVAAAGLAVAQTESVQAPAPPPGAPAAPAGVVISTRPAAGVLSAPGSGVTVVVNRGAPTIAVPDLVGMLIADARTRLETEGLEVGSVTRRRTGEANPGTVVGQRPAAGTLAAPGTVVDLVVARSPQ